jgi:hypothetical protein
MAPRAAPDPADSYGNDFLGTVYFLQGNARSRPRPGTVGKKAVNCRKLAHAAGDWALLDRAPACPASVMSALIC